MRETQLDLIKDKDRVPVRHAGELVGYKKQFRIVTASDLQMAEVAASHAGVTGSVGGSEFVYEAAGPYVGLEARAIERWAIVERIKRS